MPLPSAGGVLGFSKADATPSTNGWPCFGIFAAVGVSIVTVLVERCRPLARFPDQRGRQPQQGERVAPASGTGHGRAPDRFAVRLWAAAYRDPAAR